MPRYRFHLYNDVETRDTTGREFADHDAARDDAIDNARSLMSESLTAKGEINLSHWIEIEDEEGEMTVVEFRDAVTIKP